MTNKVYWWENVNTTTTAKSAEVQLGSEGYNMSFVIDGTKDSCKLVIFSYTESEVIKPYTIMQHRDTNTWWIVSDDKVDRQVNEDGYVYIHTLQLEGAIELLNARDLTNCGFYQNRYTVDDVIKRLFKLSTFEIPTTLVIYYNGNLSQDLVVDYIKSYDNYTLLNALRDFLDGYNCDAKLSFFVLANRLLYARLDIISKTGNSQTGVVEGDDYFNGVEEIEKLNKNSYGTNVVSNANNVVSTEHKTFPLLGGVPLTSDSETVTMDNGKIRLPSNIFKVNWLKINTCCLYRILIGSFDRTIYFYNNNDYYNNTIYENIVNEWYNNHGYAQELQDEIRDWLLGQARDIVFSILEKATSITLYNVDKWNPYDKNFVKPSNDFVFVEWKRVDSSSENHTENLVLCPKSVKDGTTRVLNKYFTIGWERGKDYIDVNYILAGIDTGNTQEARVTSYKYTDLGTDTYDDGLVPLVTNVFGQNSVHVGIVLKGIDLQDSAKINNTTFVVDYVPMSDIKIKLDNNSYGNNSKLFNQNGKINDSNSLSKRLLSYKDEIISNNLTKYAIAYKFSDILKAGQVVAYNNDVYVINSVSIDLFQNENLQYYFVVEYTLSKDIAVKSLMVNPNTNVRDYGIPQEYNIKRVQLYRDFYELSYSKDTNADSDYYLPLDKCMNIGTGRRELVGEHIAIIKAVYKVPVGGDSDNNIDPSDTWYYQLNTTRYNMKKSFYEIVDFKDNNIIGYGALNIFSGFDVTKLLFGLDNVANTPISYVDDDGEVKDLYLAFVDKEDINSIYQSYIEEKGIVNDITGSFYNASPFVDPLIYEGNGTTIIGANGRNDFLISEIDYKKDAIEVPVFEYSFQIDDTEEVTIGENILNDYDGIYFYQFIIAPKGTVTNNNFKNLSFKPVVVSNVIATMDNSVKLQYGYISGVLDSIVINLYSSVAYNAGAGTMTYGANVNLEDLDLENNDIVIVKRVFDGYTVSNDELVFVLKDCYKIDTTHQSISLKINHYKLK